jgi:hypothetical protein
MIGNTTAFKIFKRLFGLKKYFLSVDNSGKNVKRCRRQCLKFLTASPTGHKFFNAVADSA